MRTVDQANPATTWFDIYLLLIMSSLQSEYHALLTY